MFLYLPGAHFTHRLAEAPVYPTTHPQSWIRPLRGGATEFGGHGRHTGLPSGEYSVEPQLAHVSLLVAPKFSEYVPTVQFEHASCASRGLYVPGRHCVQPSPSCRKPTLHWQKSFDMLATTDVEFPGHAKHVSIDVALLCAEYVLAGHEVHTSEPIVSLYFPSWHAEQLILGFPKICHSIIVK
jgi:hypothetical protein